MNQVLDFLKQYWKLISLAVLFLFNFILLIVRKKPVKIVDTIREAIAIICPYFIRVSEDKYGLGHGDVKQAYATELIIEYIKKQYSLSDDVANGYVPFINMIIKDLFNKLKDVMKGGSSNV